MNLNDLFHGCLGAYRAYAIFRHSAGHTQAHNQCSVNQMSIDGTTQLWDPHYAINVLSLSHFTSTYQFYSLMFSTIGARKLMGRPQNLTDGLSCSLWSGHWWVFPICCCLYKPLCCLNNNGPTNGSLLRYLHPGFTASSVSYPKHISDDPKSQNHERTELFLFKFGSSSWISSLKTLAILGYCSSVYIYIYLCKQIPIYIPQ